ncbi:hypothetical protein QFZ98_007929 [Paraburkholderia youngii]
MKEAGLLFAGIFYVTRAHGACLPAESHLLKCSNVSRNGRLEITIGPVNGVSRSTIT